MAGINTAFLRRHFHGHSLEVTKQPAGSTGDTMGAAIALHDGQGQQRESGGESTSGERCLRCAREGRKTPGPGPSWAGEPRARPRRPPGPYRPGPRGTCAVSREARGGAGDVVERGAVAVAEHGAAEGDEPPPQGLGQRRGPLRPRHRAQAAHARCGPGGEEPGWGRGDAGLGAGAGPRLGRERCRGWGGGSRASAPGMEPEPTGARLWRNGARSAAPGARRCRRHRFDSFWISQRDFFFFFYSARGGCSFLRS